MAWISYLVSAGCQPGKGGDNGSPKGPLGAQGLPPNITTFVKGDQLWFRSGPSWFRSTASQAACFRVWVLINDSPQRVQKGQCGNSDVKRFSAPGGLYLGNDAPQHVSHRRATSPQNAP